MAFRAPPVIVRGPAWAAIRAFRTETREDLFRRQHAFLGAGNPAQDARLRRSLRAERRAASAGTNYDLARHFALARLCKNHGLRPSGPRHTSGEETEPGADPCPRQAAPRSSNPMPNGSRR